jgi:hypothetical protein
MKHLLHCIIILLIGHKQLIQSGITPIERKLSDDGYEPVYDASALQMNTVTTSPDVIVNAKGVAIEIDVCSGSCTVVVQNG